MRRHLLITPGDQRALDAPVVDPPGDTRSETTRRVESRLRQTGYNSLRDVSCDDSEGVLRLRGALPTYYLKQIALAAARASAGDRCIVDEIRVVVPSRPIPPGPVEVSLPRWGWTNEAARNFIDVTENIG